MRDKAKTMKRIRRELTKVIQAYETACGFEEALQKAHSLRWKLERFIEDELGNKNVAGS